jgi:hypothetical protein
MSVLSRFRILTKILAIIILIGRMAAGIIEVGKFLSTVRAA